MPANDLVLTVAHGNREPGDPRSSEYAAYRCDKCSEIHLSIIGHSLMRGITLPGGKVVVQLGLNAAEARQLAAALLAQAEGH